MVIEMYNGWTNYETWNVKLWMDNDQGSYEYWQERTDYWRNEESTSTQWTKEQSTKFNLADEIENQIKDDSPLGDDASMYSDLLSASLSNVNWQEIAENLLSD